MCVSTVPEYGTGNGANVNVARALDDVSEYIDDCTMIRRGQGPRSISEDAWKTPTSARIMTNSHGNSGNSSDGKLYEWKQHECSCDR